MCFYFKNVLIRLVYKDPSIVICMNGIGLVLHGVHEIVIDIDIITGIQRLTKIRIAELLQKL